MVTFRKIFLLTICCTISIVAGAQKVKTVSATIAYHASESMSVEEAKRIALERAKIQAIADEFGTIVSQNNSTIVKNINGKSNIDFISIFSVDKSRTDEYNCLSVNIGVCYVSEFDRYLFDRKQSGVQRIRN